MTRHGWFWGHGVNGLGAELQLARRERSQSWVVGDRGGETGYVGAPGWGWASCSRTSRAPHVSQTTGCVREAECGCRETGGPQGEPPWPPCTPSPPSRPLGTTERICTHGWALPCDPTMLLSGACSCGQHRGQMEDFTSHTSSGLGSDSQKTTLKCPRKSGAWGHWAWGRHRGAPALGFGQPGSGRCVPQKDTAAPRRGPGPAVHSLRPGHGALCTVVASALDAPRTAAWTLNLREGSVLMPRAAGWEQGTELGQQRGRPGAAPSSPWGNCPLLVSTTRMGETRGGGQLLGWWQRR